MNERKIAAAYIRVSTDDQLDYSPESQLDEIKKFSEKNGYIILEDCIFMEPEGHSGKKADNRPEFQRMIATAKQTPKPFDAILVWKFSRFARNQDESTFYKSMLRKKLGIDVISVSEPVLDGMYGRLIEMIIEWQDEFYSYNLAAEVTRGMKKKAEKGEPQVLPPLGYRVPYKGAVPEIVPDEADIAKLIFRMFLEGDSPFTIARYLSEHGVTGKRGGHIWSNCIKRMLSNPYYIGYSRWNGITKKGEFPAIISEEDFAEVQKLLNNTKNPKYAKPDELYKHWLSGIVRCSSCGKTLTSQRIHSPNGDYIIFQCGGYTRGICHTSHYVREKVLERAVIADLEEVIQLGTVEFTIRQPGPNYTSQADLVNAQIIKINSKLERVRDSYLAGIDTMEEYKASKLSLTEELKKLQKQAEMLQPDHNKATEKMLLNIRYVCDILKSENYNVSEKNNALKSIIEKIIFDKKKHHVDIFYYLNETDLLP